MAEIERLREENRHLLNCLLRRDGMPAVGEAAPTVANNPRVSIRQRAAQLEREAWERWNQSVGIATKPQAQKE